MRHLPWLAALCAALTPAALPAAFTLTVVSAPAGYTGPVAGTTSAAAPDSILFSTGTLSTDTGRVAIESTREQFPTYAAIGTTFQFKAATAPPAPGAAYVPAGTYQVRVRNDEFTLPPGTAGTVGVIHTSIIPYAAAPGTPLATTTATSQVPGGAAATVTGSPMLTQMFEALTPKPDGVYTLDQLVTVNLPAGGSAQFSVTSYISAVPAPPALALCAIGLPLFGAGLRALRRRGRAAPGGGSPAPGR